MLTFQTSEQRKLKCRWMAMYIWLSVILVFITVVFFVLYLVFRNKETKAKKSGLLVSQGGKEILVYHGASCFRLFFILFAISFLILACLIVYLAFRLKVVEGAVTAAPSPTPSTVVAATHTPENTVSPSPEMPPLPNAELVVWLDELTPYSDYKGNFTMGGWSDCSSFLVGGREYSRGIGMQICGTDKEDLVDDADTSEGVYKHNCKETHLRYALRYNYSKLVFSIGVDSNNKSVYGPEERNGSGRVVITNISKNSQDDLFDTGWVDYQYSKYEAEVPLKDVDLLEITIMSEGYEKSGTKGGLRFAIIDPILYLG